MMFYDKIRQDKRHVLDMFRTCSEKVLGVKNEVFPKSLGDLWAIIWHHRRCLGRGLKFSKTYFPQKISSVKKTQNDLLMGSPDSEYSYLFSGAIS